MYVYCMYTYIRHVVNMGSFLSTLFKLVKILDPNVIILQRNERQNCS